MSFSRPTKSLARLWALLFVAFLVVGVSAGIATLHLALDQYTTDLRTDLVNTARLMALSVDPADHEKLRSVDDMRGPIYRRMNDQLARAQREATEIRYVHTLRRTQDGNFVFVLDPMAPGDHDADGVDDKSYLLDPYPEVTPYAKRCFETGMPVAEPNYVTDRWGKLWSAYAPITDVEGRVVGVLAVQRDAESIEHHLFALYRAGIVGLILVVGLSLLFSFILARQLDRQNRMREPGLPLQTGRTLRATILELILAGLTFSVLLVGVSSRFFQAGMISDVDRLKSRSSEIYDMQRRVDKLGMQAQLDGRELRSIAGLAGHRNMGWLLAMKEDVVSAGAGWRKEVANISSQLSIEDDRNERAQRTLMRQVNAEDAVFSVAFFVALALGLASLGLVRAAVRHHLDLMRAQSESEELKQAYQQIADHLPIGLFMLRRGEIAFSNTAWDAQVLRQPDEDRRAAFFRALHPEDADEVNERLLCPNPTRDAVDLKYRLVLQAGEVRTMESRAVPVSNSDGELDHLLGFAVDVTSRVEAEQELIHKQGEAEAKNEMLANAVRDLEDNFQAMVHALVKAVEAKDPYTAGHSERVMGYSVKIGRAMGLSSADMLVLERGTLIHDIGKIGIPDNILTKPGRLSPEEVEVIRAHPSIGAEMVEKIPLFERCIPVIRWHHERLTGDGYPDGLMGDEIPLIVRIAAVADSFDAMTSSRAYRSALGTQHALDELRVEAEKGSLDPEVIAALTDIVEREGILWIPPMDQAA